MEKISDDIIKAVKMVDGVEKVEMSGRNLDIICDSKIKIKVIFAIVKADGNIIDFNTEDTSLEKVIFFILTFRHNRFIYYL